MAQDDLPLHNLSSCHHLIVEWEVVLRHLWRRLHPRNFWGGGILGTFGVSLVMLLVIRMSACPNGCIVCTLGSAWEMPSLRSALVCGAGFDDLVMAVLFLTDFSVSCSSCFISFDPLLLPIFSWLWHNMLWQP